MTNAVFKPHKYSLGVYLLLAFGITWLCWIPVFVINARYGYLLPGFNTYADLFKSGFTDARHLWLAIIFQLGVYGPLIGGLTATWMDGGREGLRDLWGRMRKWNIGGRWYLTAIAITFLLTALPVAIFALTGNFILSTVPISIVLFAFLVQLLTSGLGEEPGWRGFLLPRLQARFPGEKHIWVLGLIWAAWHFPIVIFQTLAMVQNVSVPQLVITMVMALAGQTMSLIGMTYIYVWLYNQTNSVFLVIIFHALSNLFNSWIPTFLTNPQAVGLLPAVMPWIVVFILQKKLGKDRFPGLTN